MNVIAEIASSFDQIRIQDLENLSPAEIDRLPFGIIGMSADSTVEIYGATESRQSGLSPSSIVGAHFFLTTAQCMNNYMVAQRFEDEDQLDAIIDYVLTLRMRPTPVRLRLLKHPAARRRYILIQR
jgi:photoactive yellow protein